MMENSAESFDLQEYMARGVEHLVPDALRATLPCSPRNDIM